MADDRFAPNSANHATGRSSSFAGIAPPGYGMRRAATVDETAHLRCGPTLNTDSPRNSFNSARPRNSNSRISENSPNDLETSTEGFWDLGKNRTDPSEKHPYAAAPLVLALLPAVGGLLFKGGSEFFTDVILLGLAAIFLHWSVTQPWNWYHSAQRIRFANEVAMSTPVFDSDSECGISSAASVTTALEDAPKVREEEQGPELSDEEPRTTAAQQKWEAERDAAAKELYIHEIMALTWCFTFPMLGAFLLHTVRGQLSRPSEGLVCDYNLCIFLIAAEIRPIAHVIKLLQNRTLRKQRLVGRNPYDQEDVRGQQMQRLYARMDELEEQFEARAAELEARTVPGDLMLDASVETEQTTIRAMENLLARNLQENIQPEMDTLNRAMRRYEKKFNTLVNQLDIKLDYLKQRGEDAIALAAAVAHNNNQGSIWSWLVEQIASLIMLPFQTAVAVCSFIFRTVSSPLGRTSRLTTEKSYKKGRWSSTSGRTREDRVPTRMSRR
ncbi:hypothetical protein BJ170DRAFT_622777 [Xylariales sp. AK1849]|nr:hypothetical protein BJ170DRAFT_622777 [Xylariales sp. AK1849]